jgi:FAD/FMN-containing dehydrogenase
LGAECNQLFKQLKNPYYIGDTPELTQTLGWLDAWTSAQSTYAVAAEKTEDVVAAINFAREHNLRLVVKGGGHSYQGTSNAPDSLLLWTRALNTVQLRDAFVPQGCDGRQSPQPAVTVGAGAIWIQAYNAVTTQGGRYVQGGGCSTVGVAGLVQSGGFGSFSKRYGTAAAGLLEAEIVTADGAVRVVNSCREPDLFWALKGGGGGTLGIVTRLTLRTRELPEFFGGVFGVIKANSDAAFRVLVAKMIAFYRDRLFNPHWGEQISIRRGNALGLSLVFQGLDRQRAAEIWKPFFDWLAHSPDEFSFEEPLQILDIPARHFWDASYMKKNLPQAIVSDDRPSAPESNTFWEGDHGQVGWFVHAYKSAWLPATLLTPARQSSLVDALIASSRRFSVSLHFNKGLAGAPEAELAAARDTATNPAVLSAFALAIIATGSGPALPNLPGHEPDLATARRNARAVAASMEELQKVIPSPASYVSESDYFEPAWQQSFWGSNYLRLAAVKKKYDPEGLFFVHHGPGSQEWTADGFARL